MSVLEFDLILAIVLDSQLHMRSQDFVWGALFPHNIDDLFLLVAFKGLSKTTNSSSKSS